MRVFLKFFYGSLVLCALWQLALPFVPWVQRCLAEKYHLRTPNFALWALQQPVPCMYNMANEVVTCSYPVNASVFDDLGALRTGSVWMNHYPVRRFTWAIERDFAFPKGESYMVARSRYRGLDYRTVWHLKLDHPSQVWSMECMCGSF
jgi:hypothetical protein